MEDVLRAIVLGVVQGLTEFLPISSSGHLIIVRELFGWEFTDDLTFDVSLHIGTTVAVLAFFWRDWVTMLRAGALWAMGDREPGGLQESRARTLLLIIIGSVPIAIVGFALADWIEDELRDPVVVGVMLIVFGIVLYIADRLASLRMALADASPSDAVIIGSSQAISLIPGVSRSGITISAALFRGFTREDAARFSFLLSTPAIGGAALFTLADAASEGTLFDDIDIILAGAITSGIVGWLSIAYLMRYIQTRSFTPFVIYRFAMGFFCIVYFGS
jgi:undecaprenyl-diphosphatase